MYVQMELKYDPQPMTDFIVSDIEIPTRVMPFIPTKSVACMSKSWLLGNVYTAKSCKDKKRDPDALKLGLVS
jgi:hypothetical protein